MTLSEPVQSSFSCPDFCPDPVPTSGTRIPFQSTRLCLSLPKPWRSPACPLGDICFPSSPESLWTGSAPRPRGRWVWLRRTLLSVFPGEALVSAAVLSALTPDWQTQVLLPSLSAMGPPLRSFLSALHPSRRVTSSPAPWAGIFTAVSGSSNPWDQQGFLIGSPT